jgi:hypothetical protein
VDVVPWSVVESCLPARARSVIGWIFFRSCSIAHPVPTVVHFLREQHAHRNGSCPSIQATFSNSLHLLCLGRSGFPLHVSFDYHLSSFYFDLPLCHYVPFYQYEVMFLCAIGMSTIWVPVALRLLLNRVSHSRAGSPFHLGLSRCSGSIPRIEFPR